MAKKHFCIRSSQVCYDFNASDTTQLSVKKGDRVHAEEKRESGATVGHNVLMFTTFWCWRSGWTWVTRIVDEEEGFVPDDFSRCTSCCPTLGFILFFTVGSSSPVAPVLDLSFGGMFGFGDFHYLPKNSTIADLRELVAPHHADYEHLALKTKKEEFRQKFVLIHNGVVFSTKNARPTWGKALNWQGGEQLLGYPIEEFNRLPVAQLNRRQRHVQMDTLLSRLSSSLRYAEQWTQETKVKEHYLSKHICAEFPNCYSCFIRVLGHLWQYINLWWVCKLHRPHRMSQKFQTFFVSRESLICQAFWRFEHIFSMNGTQLQ